MDNNIPLEKIENKIYLIRGQKVMLDGDLAFLYGVAVKRLNEQVKRNIKRFPDDFMFQLTRYEAEYLDGEIGNIGTESRSRSQIATLKMDNNGNIIGEKILKSQIATLENTNISTESVLKSQIATSSWGGKRKMPYVFTEQGVAMLSSILKTDKAIEMNIIIIRAFVKIRQLIYSYKDLADKIAKMEKEYGGNISKIFQALDALASEVDGKVDKGCVIEVKANEIGFKLD